MKLFTILNFIFLIGLSSLLAQESQTSISKNNQKSPYSVDLEAYGTVYQDSAMNNFDGMNTLLRLHTSYIFTNGNRLRLRQEFNTFFGDVYSNQDNKYQSTEVHYKFKKILNQKNSGVNLDLSLRAVYNTDSEQRKYYGSDGNLQARVQFSKGIQNWFLFASYRYQEYLSNDFTNNKSRNYRHRVRFWPSFKFNDYLSFSNKFEYTDNVLENNFNDHEIELMPEVKYSFNKDYAISLSYILKPIDNGTRVEFTKATSAAMTSINLFAKFL